MKKMIASTSLDRKGPSTVAVDPWAPTNPSTGRLPQLLTDEERAQLAIIASVVRFKKGDEIYRSGGRAEAIFNIVSGVVKCYCDSDANHIASFLFPNDVFGLSAEGVYTNSARAITPVTAYRLPTAALRGRLSKSAVLGYHVICKLCQELRQAQRHAFLLAQRHADAKIAMFIEMLRQLQVAKGGSSTEIYVPMDRSDIGEYVGLSLAAVSRTFRSLVTHGIIQTRDRRHVKVADRAAFENIVAGGSARRVGRRVKRTLRT
ncbi:MAG: Crp/Fnr family transcriptional regulator [Rhodospirillales bacterium]|nr:Crp/Fnr family transcriptional regulator [Rhodospirillales bacterium]